MLSFIIAFPCAESAKVERKCTLILNLRVTSQFLSHQTTLLGINNSCLLSFYYKREIDVINASQWDCSLLCNGKVMLNLASGECSLSLSDG